MDLYLTFTFSYIKLNVFNGHAPNLYQTHLTSTKLTQPFTSLTQPLPDSMNHFKSHSTPSRLTQIY